jgi:hypothetical protein
LLLPLLLLLLLLPPWSELEFELVPAPALPDSVAVPPAFEDPLVLDPTLPDDPLWLLWPD